MCVAIVKPLGANVPSLKTLEKCWSANPDGAGVAYNAEGGGIAIRKGLMEWKEFEKFFKQFKNAKHLTMFIHFRIKTHGSVSAGNTHPFPLAPDAETLRQCVGVFDSVMMHNGMLPFKSKIDEGSDTMELARRLSEFSADDIPKAAHLIEPLIDGNKVAIWQRDHKPILLGHWYKKDGVFFSNLNHESGGMLKSFGGGWFDGFKKSKKNAHDPDDPYDEYGNWYIETPNALDKQSLKRGRCPWCDNEVDKTYNGDYVCYYCGTMFKMK